MNIGNFLHKQAPQSLTQVQKSRLYSDFLTKREHKTKTNRWGLVSKRFALYTSVSILIIGSLFLYPFQNGIIIDKVNNQVMAQTIGSIMDSQGNFSISSNGRIIKSDSIQLKDIITLERGSKVKILINDSFQTEIIGPARFEIVPVVEQERTLYSLKFMNGGDFVTINTNNKKNNSEISIETAQGVIIKNKTNKEEKNNIAFTVIGSSSSNNTTIVNKSDVAIEASTIGTLGSEKKHETITIAPTQIAELSTNTSGENKDNIQLLQTKPFEAEEERKLLAEVNFALTPKPASVSSKPYNGEVITNEEIKELSKEQRNQIEQNLYKSFIENDIENIITYHLLGNKQASEISRSNLNNRIIRIAKVLNINTSKGGESIKSLVGAIEEVSEGMNKQYPNESTKTLRNLITAKNRLTLIDIYEFGGHDTLELYNNNALNINEITEILKIRKNEREYKFR